MQSSIRQTFFWTKNLSKEDYGIDQYGRDKYGRDKYGRDKYWVLLKLLADKNSC